MKCLQIVTGRNKIRKWLSFLIAQFQEYPEDTQVENRSADLGNNYLLNSSSVSSPESYILCAVFTHLFHSKQMKNSLSFL